MPKRYLTRGGEGKDLKNQAKSNYYFYRILKTSKEIVQKFINFYKKLTFTEYDRIGREGLRATNGGYNISSLIKNLRFRIAGSNTYTQVFQKIFRGIKKSSIQLAGTSCRGSILIEFAVCMPILIILLFYINDLVRIKRYYAQTEFVGQQMANILQNISQKRENKRIKKNDFKYAFSLAFLTMYPGKTMFWTSGSNNREFVYTPSVATYYIKGENGTASVLWRVNQYIDSRSGISPLTTFFSPTKNPTYSSSNYHILHAGQNVAPSSIHPLLKIQDGDEKIILEVKVERGSSYRNMAGQALNDKQAMGLFLVNPKFYGSSTGWHHLFHSFVIFTPKPGLFSEDTPN